MNQGQVLNRSDENRRWVNDFIFIPAKYYHDLRGLQKKRIQVKHKAQQEKTEMECHQDYGVPRKGIFEVGL